MFHEKKVFLKFSWNSEDYSCLRVPETWKVSKMRPQYRCFPANLGKFWFFSGQFFTEHLGVTASLFYDTAIINIPDWKLE